MSDSMYTGVSEGLVQIAEAAEARLLGTLTADAATALYLPEMLTQFRATALAHARAADRSPVDADVAAEYLKTRFDKDVDILIGNAQARVETQRREAVQTFREIAARQGMRDRLTAPHGGAVMIAQLDLLAHFDDLALRQPTRLAERLTRAGIPRSLQGPAQHDLAMALAGIRDVVCGWSPRPAFQDLAEQRTLQDALREFGAGELDWVANEHIASCTRSAMRVTKLLADWQHERKVFKVAPTDADIAAQSDRADGTDRDGVRFIDAGNGQQAARYNVKPDPQDVLAEQRRQRRLRQQRQRQG